MKCWWEEQQPKYQLRHCSFSSGSVLPHQPLCREQRQLIRHFHLFIIDCWAECDNLCLDTRQNISEHVCTISPIHNYVDQEPMAISVITECAPPGLAGDVSPPFDRPCIAFHFLLYMLCTVMWYKWWKWWLSKDTVHSLLIWFLLPLPPLIKSCC